jgi:hypothetical protein
VVADLEPGELSRLLASRRGVVILTSTLIRWLGCAALSITVHGWCRLVACTGHKTFRQANETTLLYFAVQSSPVKWTVARACTCAATVRT